MSDLFDAPRKLTKGIFGGGGLPDPLGLFGGGSGGGGFGKSITAALTGALSKMQQPEPAPTTLITPGAMPTPNSGEQRQAKRKSYAQQLARKGRASTILTAADDNDSLGA